MSWLWGREPDADEQARRISALREACPTATAGTARRFLVARDWSLDKATKMLSKHVEWNESEQAAVVGKLGLTSQRTVSREGLSEEVTGILASKRFRLLVGGAEPVIIVDFLWGKFMDGVSADSLMTAYLVFLAEVLGNADALREPDLPAKVKSILVGGSPPMAYVRLTHPVFEANFPERLGTSAVYPVPWVIKVIVDASTCPAPASHSQPQPIASPPSAPADSLASVTTSACRRSALLPSEGDAEEDLPRVDAQAAVRACRRGGGRLARGAAEGRRRHQGQGARLQPDRPRQRRAGGRAGRPERRVSAATSERAPPRAAGRGARGWRGLRAERVPGTSRALQPICIALRATPGVQVRHDLMNLMMVMAHGVCVASRRLGAAHPQVDAAALAPSYTMRGRSARCVARRQRGTFHIHISSDAFSVHTVSQ
jgi:hypothetical protein